MLDVEVVVVVRYVQSNKFLYICTQCLTSVIAMHTAVCVAACYRL
jgi:hypothetical protein